MPRAWFAANRDNASTAKKLKNAKRSTRRYTEITDSLEGLNAKRVQQTEYDARGVSKACTQIDLIQKNWSIGKSREM